MICINKEFGIPLVTKKEIGQYLTKLDTKKATGMDNISSCLLKDTKGVTIEALCNIVNTSIEAGIFPTSWKRAKVVPLHKSGSHDNMDNFRPISILPVASKILEKHVYKHLYSYFNTNNLLCETQSGFRQTYSCGTCLINIIEFCYKQLNADKIVGFIALDFRKAF